MKALLLAAALVPLLGRAQYWRAIGRGVTTSTGGVQLLYGDSVGDRLIGAGPWPVIYNQTDTIEATGIAAWNGLRWDSLGHRLAPAALQTHCLERFNGVLYASGNWYFQNENGLWTTGFARFNDTTRRWSDLGCYNPQFSGLGTLTLKADGSGFYCTGWMGDPCTLPEAPVFTYDGSTYASWAPYQQIPFDAGDYVGFVFEFRGMSYMTGDFRDPLSEGYCSLMRHNGTSWEYVPGWGQLQVPIKEFSIHNDTLYLAGTFRRSMGAPGNLIARFDGTTWDDMGGGLFYEPVPMSGAALDLLWHHNELWVVGMFTRAGDIPAESVAKWNGRQWCALPADFHGHLPNMTEVGLNSITSWRDSVYLSGAFSYINGEPIRQVAQWLGGDTTVACSTPVGVGVATPQAPPHLQVHGTPLPGVWRLALPRNGSWNYRIYDTTGRVVVQDHTAGNTILVDLSAYSPGVYAVALHDGESRYTTKLLRP